MELTEEAALQAYARMMNTLSAAPFEGLLAENFIHESQKVLTPIESKQAFLDYIRAKFKTIRDVGATVFAELGEVSAYGSRRPCVILAQNDKANLVGLALAKVSNGKVARIDLCIVPPPQTAQRSGEYPN